MNKNKIEITIELQSGVKAKLQLVPEDYKQSFRDFRRKYDIGDEQALRLKKIIQLALVEISKMKFQTLQKDGIVHNHQQQDLEQHHVESPRFNKMHAEEQVHSQFAVKQQKQMAATQKKEEVLKQFSVQQENIQNIPIISVQDLKNIHEEVPIQQEKAIVPVAMQKQIESLKQEKENELFLSPVFQDQFSQTDLQESQHQDNDEDPQPRPAVPPLKLDYLMKYEASLPTGLKQPSLQSHSHRKTQNQNYHKTPKENVKAKPQKKVPSKKIQFEQWHSQDQSRRFTYDRLYYQRTDSFKSKKNEQINRKQLNDYIEVQKYDLNNRLKRTTKDFFYQLHNRTTECWEHRARSKSKEKSISETQKKYTTLPTKKVSIEKAFKGSFWESRSRCQAHIYQQKLSKQKTKEQANRKTKEAQIRKRIKEQRSNPKSADKKEVQHLSRSCEKCSPKKVKTPKRAPKVIFKSKQKEKKPYISDILIQAYQQRIKQMKALNIQ